MTQANLTIQLRSGRLNWIVLLKIRHLQYLLFLFLTISFSIFLNDLVIDDLEIIFWRFSMIGIDMKKN